MVYDVLLFLFFLETITAILLLLAGLFFFWVESEVEALGARLWFNQTIVIVALNIRLLLLLEQLLWWCVEFLLGRG